MYIYICSSYCFCYRTSKTLGTSPVQQQQIYLLLSYWGNFWKAPKCEGWLPEESIKWLVLDLSVPPYWPLGRGEGLKVESINNGSWFSESDASMKTQKDRFRELLGLSMCGDTKRVILLEMTWKLSTFPIPCLMHLFHLSIPELQLFIIKQQSSK